MTWYHHLLAIALGVIVPTVTLLRRRPAADSPVVVLTSGEKISIYWSNAILTLLLAGVSIGLWRLGGGTWDRLGMTFPGERVTLGVIWGLAFIAWYVVDAWWHLSGTRVSVTKMRWQRDTPFMPANRRELTHSMVMVIGASVGEEIVYRGFLIAYLMTMTSGWDGSATLAVVLPAAVFGVSHVYQGVSSALKIGVLATLFGVMVVVTGSLWIAITVHFIVDVVGMALGLRLMGTGDSTSSG